MSALFLLFVLAIFGYAFLLRYKFPGMGSGAAFCTSLYGMGLFMYIFGLLCNLLQVTACLLLILGNLLFIIILVINIKKRTINFKDLIAPGSILVLVTVVYVYVVLHNKEVTGHDSFSHWAVSVKELYYSNTAYPNINSGLAHGDYPPVLTLIQYIPTVVFGYQESFIYMVQALLFLAPICWLADDFDSSREHKVGLLLFIVCFLITYPIMYPTYTIDQLLADGILSVLPAAILLKWFMNEKILDFKSSFPFIVMLACLPSVKILSGFAFALIILAFIIGTIVRKFILKNDKETKKKALILIFALFLTTILVYVSWNAFYNYNNKKVIYEKSIQQIEFSGVGDINNVEKQPFVFSDLFYIKNFRSENLEAALKNEDTIDKEDIVKQTVKSITHLGLFRNSIFYTEAIPKYTVILAAVVLFCLFYANRNQRKAFLLIAVIWFILCVVYSIGTIYTYISHIKKVTSVFRYFGVLVIMATTVVSYLIGSVYSKSQKKHKTFLIICCICFFSLILFNVRSNLYFDAYLCPQPQAKEKEVLISKQYSRILSSEIKKEDKVLIIDGSVECHENISSLLDYTTYYYSLPFYAKQPIEYDSNTGEYNIGLYELKEEVMLNCYTKIVFINPTKKLKEMFSEFELDTSLEVVTYGVTISESNIYFIKLT